MSWEGAPAPYRIETERLVIRCYEPADAPLLTEALNSSIEHLRPFMPWADDLPQSVEDSYALCRRFRAAFDSDEQYVCGFFESADRRLPGRAGGPLRDVTIFTMFREDFDPAIAPDLRAFDALGRQLV